MAAHPKQSKTKQSNPIKAESQSPPQAFSGPNYGQPKANNNIGNMGGINRQHSGGNKKQRKPAKPPAYLILLCVYAVLFPISEAISACDDVDISFFIDADWIINGDSDQIVELITRIIADGSSENAGFSAAIYGSDNIPMNQKIRIFDIDDTASVQQRGKEIEFVQRKLMNAFANIANAAKKKPNKPTKSVTLNEAISVGLRSKPNKPSRNHRKTQMLQRRAQNQGQKPVRMGLKDDENVIFIFNFDGTFNNDTGDVCDIVDANEERRKFNETELHFLFGAELNQNLSEIETGMFADCAEHTDTLISLRVLDDSLLNDSSAMEQIFSLSCPAEIISADGYTNLGNHVQWIDADTIIECSMEMGYVLVRDYIDDDNTFKVYDYLIADLTTFADLPQGCDSSVFKIMDILTENGTNVTDDTYIIRKLLVRLPATPQEYISDTNTSGAHHKLYSRDNVDSNDTNHRRRTAWDTIGKSGTENLISLTYENSVTTTKSASFEGSKSLWGDATADFSGSVELTLETGYSFDISIDLEYDFSWSVFSGDIHIEFAVVGSWEVSAWFTLGITGSAAVELNDLLSYDHLFTFTAGIIPILIKPFINIGGKIELIPLEIEAGISCTYGESYKIGYYYDKQVYYEGPYDDFRNNYKFKSSKLSQKMDRYDVESLNACIGEAYEKGNCVWVDYKPADDADISFTDPADGSYMVVGDVLYVGDRITSEDGSARAVLQPDGNFVVYKSGAQWSTGTRVSSECCNNRRVVLQPDGNLVLYTGSRRAKWASGTNSGSGCCSDYILIIENDANLALYDGSGNILWGSEHTNNGRSRCRCFSGANIGDISSDSDWDSYTLDVNCGSLYDNCAGCGTEFWIRKKNSNAVSCAFLDKWECRSCPIWTHGSGTWETTVDEHDIFERTVDSNGCETTLSAGGSDTTCPALELGFDATLEVQIGAYFYEVVKVYVKAELEFPLRIIMPVMADPTICGFSADKDMCTLTWMRAALTYELGLNIYFGYELSFDQFVDTVQQLINGASWATDTDLAGTEIPLYSLEIIPATSHCLSLNPNAGLSGLTSFFKELCCSSSAKIAHETNEVRGDHRTIFEPFQQKSVNDFKNNFALKDVTVNDGLIVGIIVLVLLTVVNTILCCKNKNQKYQQLSMYSENEATEFVGSDIES